MTAPRWVAKRIDALALRPGEAGRVVLSFGYFFALLASYYVLRPLREEMGVRVGVGNLQWLFTGTFVAMLMVAPLFGTLTARVSRSRLVPATTLFFAANLVLFFVVFRSHRWADVVAPAFFIWLSVFNLFAVSVFWSFMSDLYRQDEAARLFGVIAAGGSLGAIAGPALAALFATRLGPESLVLIAAAMLIACWALTRGLLGRATSISTGEISKPIGGSALAGIDRTVRSPLLLGIALIVVSTTVLSTFLYFSQAEVVGQAIVDSGRRTSLFAMVDLAVNVSTILLQLLVTGSVIRRLGIGVAMALTPAVVAMGLVSVGVAPGVGGILTLMVIHRAGRFSVGRPAREVLFVTLDAETRYKAKNFIDTVVFRASDAVSAWVLTGVRAMGAGLAHVLWGAVPVAILLAATSWVVGRAGDRKPATAPAGE